MFQSSKLALVPLIIAIPLASGCGGSELNERQVASAQSAVRGAVEAGAPNDPIAAVYLQIARDEMKQATAAADAGHNDRASVMLERARIDAEVAIAMSRRAEAIASAQEAQARLNALSAQATQ